MDTGGIRSIIGNTPLVELPVSGYDDRIRFFAKLEGVNPGGSLKDRVAHYIIMKGMESGSLKRGMIVLDGTSGSMGVSLGMICAGMGLDLKICLPENICETFTGLIKLSGAELIKTQSKQGVDGAVKKAYEIFESDPDKYFFANHFNNGANPQAHYETTGREILEQTGGEVTHLVAGMGTCGTIMGAGRRLRARDSGIQTIGIEPEKGHDLAGLRNFDAADMPAPGIYDPSKINRIIRVNDDNALSAAKTLMKQYGISAGPTSGAAFYGALEHAKDSPAGSTFVIIFPDRADRYVSSTLSTYTT